ncbi:ABC transporter [Catellatospora sp. TT07R-123]|uniref:ABC transporter ATP-binding protein n=1 Tax=Catellatospora sp. TT07R-123 TaxID=2733863 RepID=UPI001B13E53A|nr:ABC transporter ATP-binding protein [Catellatospora sp. TT07R-123]GHJ48916.1 ABC transporter [Catellatospora sp. TT07R-123]
MTATPPAAIRIRGLRKSYGGRDAVSGLDLTVASGEVFALLGPNGAGKTTTVEILEGYRRRDGGDVAVLGTDPGTAGRAWRARIGIVAQSANDLGDLTVSEAVRHFATCYPAPRDPGQVLDLVGLTAKAGSRVRTLSGGQRRRLDVAIGIVGRPELLFLDEPTTGFDPEARRQFWDLIRLLNAEGTTILLTTHYLDEAEVLADRLAVIAAGRIVAEGTPASIGDREAQLATVTWSDAGGRRTEQSADPAVLIAKLAAAGPVADLTVSRPTLEQTYLTLIGADR